MPLTLDPYLKLLGLIVLLFFLPKILLRFGLPSPITELLLGVACGPLGLHLVDGSELLQGLAGIGISALFLFAGIEVDIHEMHERRQVLLQHLAIQVLLFAAAAGVGMSLGWSLPVAALIGAAIMSPSAGFIVPALEALGLSASLASWIKQKAIGTELMAIAAVLVFANTGSLRDLLVGLGGVLGLLVVLPVAPVRTAINSFRFFSAFFVPFYFFGVGLLLPVGALTSTAFLFALVLFAGAVPLRVASVALHRHYGLGEPWRGAINVGLLLGPTTVFSFAVAEILRNRFGVVDWIFGGLILYGAATSMVPVLTRRAPSTEFEDVVPLAPQAP